MKGTAVLSLVAIACAFFLMLSGGCAKNTASTSTAAAPTATVAAEPEQVTCPVMKGQPISEEYYVDYKGRRFYFCCEHCVNEFKKDPEKYIPYVDAEIAAQRQPQAAQPR